MVLSFNPSKESFSMLKSGVRLNGVRAELAFVMPIIRGVFMAKNAPFKIRNVAEAPDKRTGLLPQGRLERNSVEIDLSPLGDNGAIADILRAALGDEFTVELNDCFRIEYRP